MTSNTVTDIPDQVDILPDDSGTTPETVFAGSLYMKQDWANYLIFIAAGLAILWALYNVWCINSIVMNPAKIQINK